MPEPDVRLSELQVALPLSDDDEVALTQQVAPGVKGTRRSTLAALSTKFGISDLDGRLDALEDDHQVIVAAGATLTVTRAAHQGRTIILDGAGASIALNAATQGAGLVFTVRNNTGAAWAIPTFTGAAKAFPRGAAHTHLYAGSSAAFEVMTLSGVLTVDINGDTYAP